MKIIRRKREIKLENLLYEKKYVIYNYLNNTKRKTDYTYTKWRAQKFKNNENRG